MRTADAVHHGPFGRHAGRQVPGLQMKDTRASPELLNPDDASIPLHQILTRFHGDETPTARRQPDP